MAVEMTKEMETIAKDLHETLGVSFKDKWYPYTLDDMKELQKLAHPSATLPSEQQDKSRAAVDRIMRANEFEASLSSKTRQMRREGASSLTIAQELYRTIQTSDKRYDIFSQSAINRTLAEISRTCAEAEPNVKTTIHFDDGRVMTPAELYEERAEKHDWRKTPIPILNFAQESDFTNDGTVHIPIRLIAPHRLAELRDRGAMYKSGKDINATNMLASFMVRSNSPVPEYFDIARVQQIGGFTDAEMRQAIKDNAYTMDSMNEKQVSRLLGYAKEFVKQHPLEKDARTPDRYARQYVRTLEAAHDSAQFKHCIRKANAPALVSLVAKVYTRKLNREMTDMRVSAMDKLKSMKQSLSQFFADVRSDAKTVAKLKVMQHIAHPKRSRSEVR